MKTLAWDVTLVVFILAAVIAYAGLALKIVGLL